MDADDRPPEVDLDDRTAVRFQAPQRRVGEQPGHDREAGTAEDFPAECRDGRHRARTERAGAGEQAQIGRASCRERVCQYVEVSVVAVSLKKKKIKKNLNKD